MTDMTKIAIAALVSAVVVTVLWREVTRGGESPTIQVPMQVIR